MPVRVLAPALACLLTLSTTAWSAPAPGPAAAPIALPRGVSAGPCVEGICEYTLQNGLRVLLFPDASRPTVTVNLAYGVGSVHENYGETGMAHLLEHLLFKGTPTHTDIAGELKKRGIRANATTSLDRTNYFGSFPANDATLDWLLALEADRMVNSFVAKKDLDSEMTVVRNEMERNENSPAGVMFQRLRSTAYLWHNYGNSTIGARSDVENVPIERLQAFYRTHYRPDNATLIVAGRIDPAAALARVQRHFGPLKRPTKPLPAAYTAEPTQDGEREVTVRRSGDVRIVGLGYHVPGATHADTAALAVLMNVLGHTPGGRLHKALVESRLATGAGAASSGLRERGLATASIVLPLDGDAARAETELLDQLESLAKRPVTAAEVEQAQRRIAHAYETGMTDVNAVAMGLTESVAAGDWRLYFLQRDRISAVTAADVNRVAATYLRPSNRTLARFVPTQAAERVEIAPPPPPSQALAGYAGRAAVAAGEVFLPTPENIQARTRTLTLGNGLNVSLLPKDTRGDTVVATAAFRYGSVESLTRHPEPAASLAGAMLMRGSKTLTREQITERLVALKTSGGVGGGEQAAGMHFTSRREHLSDALALAADLLRNPAFDAAEFEQLRLQRITALEAARKEPGTAVDMAIGEHFDPWPAGHPFEHRSIEDEIAALRAITLEQVVAFHHAHYGTANGEIAIVGDFDADAVAAQLETLFAGWTAPAPHVAVPTSHRPVPAQTRRLPTPDKANAVIAARMNLPLNDTDPDYPALVIANHVLGGNALASRLGSRLRQKDGLSYSVSSSINADASRDGRDDAGSLVISAIAAPQNVDRLTTAMREELQRFAGRGITAAELADAVAGILTQREQSRASDAAVAGTLSRNLYLGRTMAWAAQFDARLKALTAEQVNAAIARRIDPSQLSVYAAGDFDGAAATQATGAASQR